MPLFDRILERTKEIGGMVVVGALAAAFILFVFVGIGAIRQEVKSEKFNLMVQQRVIGGMVVELKQLENEDVNAIVKKYVNVN